MNNPGMNLKSMAFEAESLADPPEGAPSAALLSELVRLDAEPRSRPEPAGPAARKSTIGRERPMNLD